MQNTGAIALLSLSLLAACGEPPRPSSPSPASSAPSIASAAPSASPAPVASASIAAVVDAGPAPSDGPKGLAFPGVTGPVSSDFIAYEAKKNRVWIPVGNAGSVYVFDIGANAFARVEGFKTAEKEGKNGQKRVMGPSSVIVSDTTGYVVNRATNDVCPVDTTSLELGACVRATSATDVLAYIAKVKELWVTMPDDHSIAVFDVKKPSLVKPRMTLKLDGEVEAFAVDEEHGLFYTNLEDKDKTLAIDVKTHKITASAPAGCGGDGPRGLAVDSARGLLMVACTDGVRVLDVAHGLAQLAKADTGAGVDNVDYDPRTKNLTVAAGKVAKITVLHVDDKGQLSVVGTAQTAPGARNAVVDPSGTAYVVDPKNGKLLVVPLPKAQ